jgi:hypothetical protein
VSEIDYATKSVVVTSRPPNKSLMSILKKLEKDIEINKTIAFTDESTDKTKVRFTSVKRSLKLDSLARKINSNLTSSMTFECNMCDLEGKVVLKSIDEMLLLVYNNYEQIIQTVLKSNISKLSDKIYDLSLIAKLKIHLPKWLKIHPDNAESFISGLYVDTHIDEKKIKEILDKYTLSRILKIKTDSAELVKQKTEHEKNLKNLKNYVWDEKFKQYI